MALNLRKNQTLGAPFGLTLLFFCTDLVPMYLTLEKHSHNMKEDFKPNYLFAKLYSGLPVKTCVKINKMTLIDLFE